MHAKVSRFMFLVMLVLVALSLMAASPFYRLVAQETGDLSEVQLFVIATIASVLVWLIKFARGRGWNPSNKLLTNLVFGVSLGLAILFAPLLLPPFPPFMDLVTFVPALLIYIGNLLVPLTAMVGFAVLIYDNLLKLVLDGIGNEVKKRLAAR